MWQLHGLPAVSHDGGSCGVFKDWVVHSMAGRNARLLQDLLDDAFIARPIGEQPCAERPGPAAESAVLFAGGLQQHAAVEESLPGRKIAIKAGAKLVPHRDRRAVILDLPTPRTALSRWAHPAEPQGARRGGFLGFRKVHPLAVHCQRGARTSPRLT
jgi:hypothetical protein